MTDVESLVLASARGPRTVEENDAGVRVVRVAELGRVGSAPLAPGFARQIKRLAPDLVHFHVPNPTAEVEFLAARIDIPSIATYHAEVARARWLVPPYHWVQGRFLDRMRAITVGAQALAANTPTLRPLRTRTTVVPYGVEPAEWAERPAAADDIRAQYPGPIVVFTGRLVHYKGVHHLVEAMQHVDATLLVVGSGGQVAPIAGAAKQAGVTDRVVFCGSVDNADRAAFYHAADVVVLPSTSRSEGFGIVLLEAMATGTPVISTEVGSGTSWVNVDGHTGIVVPPGDSRALASAIGRIVSNPDLAVAMGEAGRRRVRERFTMSQMISAFRDVYDRVLSGSAQPSRRRVAHVITRFIVGGAQEHALRMVTHLPTQAYDAWIITGPETGPEGTLHPRAAEEGATLDVVPQLVRDPSPIRDVIALLRLRRIFRRERPDIVHTHSSKAGIVARLAARWAGVPVLVHSVHGWSFHQEMTALERAAYKRMERIAGRFTNAIVIISEQDRAKGLRARVSVPDRYEKIPLGIDVDAFAIGSHSHKLRNELRIPDRVPIVGSVMRLAPQKDPLTMVAAFDKVGATATDARFVIIGDGPMRPEVEAAVADSGIADRLVITGVRRDVAELLGDLNVFVLTSMWEGLPLAMIEAMAAGIPIVASRVDGVEEAVNDGVEGLLVEPKDPDAFADKILSLLADGELRTRVTEAARTRAAAFDIATMIHRHDELYRRLLAER